MMNDSSMVSQFTSSAVEPLYSVTREQGLETLGKKLSEIRLWLQGDMTAVEQELQTVSDLARLQQHADLASQAASHLLGRPGKRIRPLCVLLGSRLVNHPFDEAVGQVAAACELVHAATLLHDDVIDEGTERRGAAASRVVFGNSASILGGDYLLIEALERVRQAQPEDSSQEPLIASLLRTIRDMVAAEALQLERRGKAEPQREVYLRVIDGKTAALFRWALTAGAAFGSRSEKTALGQEEIAALEKAGTALGMAFQLVDDVLDLEGEPDALGKDLLADLRQGKLTWPLILACEQDPTTLALLQGLEQNPSLGADLVRRVQGLGTVADTRAFAARQAQEAQRYIMQLPESQARRALSLVIQAAVERCW